MFFKKQITVFTFLAKQQNNIFYQFYYTVTSAVFHITTPQCAEAADGKLYEWTL